MGSRVLQHRVKGLYKELIYIGREYPAGADFFHTKCKAAFQKNRDETDPAQIELLIGRGEYVLKEIEALYHLRKYRAMKARYYDKEDIGDFNKRLEELVKKL